MLARGIAAVAPALAAALGALALAGPAVALGALALAGPAAALPEGAISEFPTGPESAPTSIAAGPDGNLWFTEYKGEKIGRITPTGEIAEFAVPTPLARPEGIAAGSDGNVWFAERKGDKIGRITPTGEIAEYELPTPGAEPESITGGPYGVLWFAEVKGDKIGRITPSGEIAEFAVPTPEAELMRIAAGADGDLWFTEYEGEKIGRVTPTGEVAEFPLPDPEGGPWGIAPGPEGDIWFTEFKGDKIGRITPTGEIAEFALPSEGSFPEGIAPGPDGNLWFSEYKGERIGRITPEGAITEFPIPGGEARPAGIAAGPDGSMWFAESQANAIGRIGTGAADALLAPPTVTGGGFAGTPQACSASWSTWAAVQPSASLFGFDGTSWTLEGSKVAAGPSYTPTAEEVGDQIACAQTVTYPLLDVTVSTPTSAPVTVTTMPPEVTQAHESARRWREAAPRLARIGGARRRLPTGTVFTFSLNERARVKLLFSEPPARGQACRHCAGGRGARRSGGKHAVSVGALSFSAHKGRSRVAFQGRLSRSRKLRPGRYELTIVATNAEGTRSAPVSLRFQIVE